MSESLSVPKPPAGLKADGRRLWVSVLKDAAGQGVELDAREVAFLGSAASIADRIAALESELAGADLIVKGVAGQPVSHPHIAEIRMHRQVFAQTLARIRTDAPAESASDSGGSNRFRDAALARWSR